MAFHYDNCHSVCWERCGCSECFLCQLRKNIHFQVSGKAKFLPNDVPNMIEVVGRIAPDMVWSYIAQMKKSGSKVSLEH